MLRTSCFAIAIFSMLLCSISGTAKGGIVMTLTDDGTNLTMRATGTYDVSSLTATADIDLIVNAAFAPPLDGGLYGWAVGGPTDRYAISFDGALTGLVGALPATSVSTNTPFIFVGNSILFATGTSSTGTVDETAVFAGVSFADFGMLSGETITATWGDGDVGETATISTVTATAVPEPSSLLMFGIGVAALSVQRRRYCV